MSRQALRASDPKSPARVCPYNSRRTGRVAAVGVGAKAVVSIGEAPVGQDQFLDEEVGRGIRTGGREALPRGLPFAKDAGVLLAAGDGAVLAQEHVAAGAGRIGEGDNSLTGLLVSAVGRDSTRAGHAAPPEFCGRLPQNSGFCAALPTAGRYS